MGPVVNEARYKQILEYIEIGKKEGRLIAGGNAVGERRRRVFILRRR